MIPSSGAAVDGVAAVLAPPYALALALVHVFAGRLRVLDQLPRSRWLSVAGGVSVAYVFVHVLPEVGAAAETVDESGTVLSAVDHHVYLLTLVGFVVFYGLEGIARRGGSEATGRSDPSTPESGPMATDAPAPSGVFWIHTASFAAYNALVGYLILHREEPGVVGLTAFFVAMALHFVVNDYGLRDHHGRRYHQFGRWILAAAVLAGLAVGYAVPVGEFAVALLFAFLAGGVVLNAIKEELPAERRSRFWAFALGAAGYAIVLLAV